MKKKIILIAAFIGAIAAFYFLDLGHYLTLEGLKENLGRLDRYYEQNTQLMILGFIGVYIIVVALSLPGATILTLSAGATEETRIGRLVGG